MKILDRKWDIELVFYFSQASLPKDSFTVEAVARDSQRWVSDVVIAEQWPGGKWANLISLGFDTAIFDAFELKGVYFLKCIGLKTTGRNGGNWPRTVPSQ